MDLETSAAIQDLIHRLGHRVETRRSSVEEEDLRLGGPKQAPSSFSALALASDSVLQGVRREIDAVIAAAREHYNESLPVNNLPPELLTAILQMASEIMSPSENKKRLLANLLLVCRMWNRVVLDSPTLWTQWDSSDGLQFLKRTLVRSRSLGLAFSCFLGTDESGMLDELGPCMSRWQDVRLNLGYQGDMLFAKVQKLGRNTAPKLQKLSIRSHYVHIPLDIFNPGDPCPLEKLQLDCTPIVWSAVNFERLRYLHISDVSRTPPSEMELLQILERSQRLEYLCLKEMNLSPEPTKLPIPSQPVCLPHLSYCQISCGYTADTLIRMIRFPSCKEMAVLGVRTSGPDSISSLAHLVAVVEKAIEVTDTTLSVYRYVFGVSTAGSRKVCFCTGGGEPEAVLTWFIKTAGAALSASPAVNVVLESSFSYDWTMQTIAELGDLKSVTALRFEPGRSGSGCNPLDCLDNLGDRVQLGFPRLRILKCCIDAMSDLESLHRVVLRRHQASTSQGQGCISPLQEVIVKHGIGWDLDGNWENKLDEIQALIAGGNLIIGSQRWRLPDNLEA